MRKKTTLSRLRKLRKLRRRSRRRRRVSKKEWKMLAVPLAPAPYAAHLQTFR